MEIVQSPRHVKAVPPPFYTRGGWVLPLFGKGGFCPHPPAAAGTFPQGKAGERIATPVCGLVRNDILYSGGLVRNDAVYFGAEKSDGQLLISRPVFYVGGAKSEKNVPFFAFPLVKNRRLCYT